jgi:hypothetical protein
MPSVRVWAGRGRSALIGAFTQRNRTGRSERSTCTPSRNGSGGGNESELYLVDLNVVILGEEQGAQVDASRDASYIEASTLVSAFARDQSIIRVTLHHDLIVRRPEAVALKAGMTWGIRDGGQDAEYDALRSCHSHM